MYLRIGPVLFGPFCYNFVMKIPHLKNEKEYWTQNLLVCGIDEVGRGCLAGPVVAAAVVLPKNHRGIRNVKDSKKLSPKNRQKLFDEIISACDDFGVGLSSATEINELGIAQAIENAMSRALKMIKITPEIALVDGIQPIKTIRINQKNIIKGDEICYSISCASIVAKVFRDQIVSGLDNVYDGYEFSKHKGYGTKIHQAKIIEKGLTPEHRTLFVRKIANG